MKYLVPVLLYSRESCFRFGNGREGKSTLLVNKIFMTIFVFFQTSIVSVKNPINLIKSRNFIYKTLKKHLGSYYFCELLMQVWNKITPQRKCLCLICEKKQKKKLKPINHHVIPLSAHQSTCNETQKKFYFFRNFTFSEIFNFKEFSFLLTKNASSRVNEMTPTCFFCST